jgi:hypothetical protein
MGEHKRKEKQGFLLYHQWRENFALLDPAACKSLLIAMIDYSQTGIPPELPDKTAAYAFGTMKRWIDKDGENYRKKCDLQRERAQKRWADDAKDAAASHSMPTNPDDANNNKQEQKQQQIEEYYRLGKKNDGERVGAG